MICILKNISISLGNVDCLIFKCFFIRGEVFKRVILSNLWGALQKSSFHSETPLYKGLWKEWNVEGDLSVFLNMGETDNLCIYCFFMRFRSINFLMLFSLVVYIILVIMLKMSSLPLCQIGKPNIEKEK